MALTQEKFHTIDDIQTLPEGQRAELIDGRMYMMAPPNTVHQRISYALARKISDYIDQKKGSCEVLPAPFAVFLTQDDRNYVEPDISVICSKEKIDEKGCNGAPDWIIEVVSPSTQQMDYGIKLFKYRTAGVREYWIVDPKRRMVTLNYFEEDLINVAYSFDSTIKVGIYDDLLIGFSAIADLLDI